MRSYTLRNRGPLHLVAVCDNRISTDQRIANYLSRDEELLGQIEAKTARLQGDLWSAVLAPAAAQPTPMVALAVWGMNDVLNSQGYTQAAWLNRIPIAAWALMAAIAVFCNVLVGFDGRTARAGVVLPLALPLVIAIAFFLIADIESPRGGYIQVTPQNLLILSQSLRAQ